MAVLKFPSLQTKGTRFANKGTDLAAAMTKKKTFELNARPVLH